MSQHCQQYVVTLNLINIIFFGFIVRIPLVSIWPSVYVDSVYGIIGQPPLNLKHETAKDQKKLRNILSPHPKKTKIELNKLV